MYSASTDHWYLERIVWLIAGTVVLSGTLLGFFVHRYWLALPLLAGINMLIYSFTGFCPMAIILHGLGAKSLLEERGEGARSGSCPTH